MTKQKIEGSLKGLLSDKEYLEQMSSVIPAELGKEFVLILKSEEISMAKGVSLSLGLFISRIDSLPDASRANGRCKEVEVLLSRSNPKGLLREQLKGEFIGRIPEMQMRHFKAIVTRQRLKVYEATSIATLLLVDYFKGHNKR